MIDRCDAFQFPRKCCWIDPSISTVENTEVNDRRRRYEWMNEWRADDGSFSHKPTAKHICELEDSRWNEYTPRLHWIRIIYVEATWKRGCTCPNGSRPKECCQSLASALSSASTAGVNELRSTNWGLVMEKRGNQSRFVTAEEGRWRGRDNKW